MSLEYEKLPYIGKKRAKKLKEAGIGIEEIAKMDEDELKKHIPRISKGKLKVIIATAREITGKAYDIADSTGIDREKALVLALNDYDVESISKAKKEEIAKLLDISQEDAFNIIFNAALKTGVKKPQIKIKKEEIDDGGIVSKEGFINGFGLKSFKPEKIVKFRVVPFIIIVLLIISGISATLFLVSPGIRIDGNFSEWNGIPGYELEGLHYKYIYQGGALYFYLHKQYLFSEPDRIYVMVDDGENEGYYVSGIKATYVAEFYGWNDTLKGAVLWKHSSSEDMWNFTKTGEMQYSYGKNSIEFMINGIRKNAKVLVIEKANTTLKSAPLFVDKPTVQVEITTAGDIAKNNTPLMNIYINSPVKFVLSKVEFEYAGASITSATLVTEHGNYSGSCGNGTVIFTVDKKIFEEHMTLYAKFSGNESSLVTMDAAVYAKSLPVSYIREEKNMYLFKAPDRVRIDGAFGDWKNRESDVIMDVHDANIDLVNYSSTPDFTDVFMQVRGEFMGGDDVPIVREWVPKDSDRDTVPDKYDLYPHDFNNDGIPDNKSYVVVNGEKLPDVDGDGIPDYPYGNDMWLNTTIPDDFPKPYAGRHVSVYIGPPPPVRPKNGNDTAEIYFEDLNMGESVRLPWVPFPVNYKITITGRDGIYNAHLFKFSHGSWKNLGTVSDIASGYHAVELSTGLNITRGKMWITVFNWKHEYDMPSITKTGERSSTSMYTMHLHANINEEPGNMNWTVGSSAETIQLIANSLPLLNTYSYAYASWDYEQPLCENLTVNLPVVLLQVNDIKNDSGTDYLNISLIGKSGNTRLLVGFWNNSLQSGKLKANSPNLIPLQVVHSTIPKGYTMALNITFMSNFNAAEEDYIKITYNGSSITSDDSYLSFTANGMSITDLYTENNGTRVSNFTKGDTVSIFANITDPLGFKHINSDAVNLSVQDALGHVILSNSKMSVYTNTSCYGVFYFSFVLDGIVIDNSSTLYAFVGKYNISVEAQNNEATPEHVSMNASFWVNSNVRHAVSKWLFVPSGKYHAWFRHRIDNTGDGDDVYNFQINSNDAPPFEVSIYRDVDNNKIIDSKDVLYAIYNSSRGGWVYIRNDTDKNNEPDITVMQGDKVRFIMQVNLSLSETEPDSYVNITIASFTGNSSFTVHDEAILRASDNKTLYLGVGSSENTLYPELGSSEGEESRVTSAQWVQESSFINDFTLTGNITVTMYIYTRFATTGNVSLYMDDGTYIGGANITLVQRETEAYTVSFVPEISLIPKGHGVYLVFTADNDCDIYFNTSSYPSKINFTTTSYIYAQNVILYNVTSDGSYVEQSNYSAGDEIHVSTKIIEPFGSYDIKSVSAEILAPDGSSSNLTLGLEEDDTSLGYYIYGADYSLPADSYAGTYWVKVTAEEGNGVINYTYTSFSIACNISISPHNNGTTGTTVWYYHDIWNNGSGTDIITVEVSSTAPSNITLYVYDSSNSQWDLVAYSNTGTGWSWVNSSYDINDDGNPDFVVGEHSSVRIKVRVISSADVNTTLSVDDSVLGNSCSDSAVDYTKVPELSVYILPLVIPALMILLRKKKGYVR